MGVVLNRISAVIFVVFVNFMVSYPGIWIGWELKSSRRPADTSATADLAKGFGQGIADWNPSVLGHSAITVMTGQRTLSRIAPFLWFATALLNAAPPGLQIELTPQREPRLTRPLAASDWELESTEHLDGPWQRISAAEASWTTNGGLLSATDHRPLAGLRLYRLRQTSPPSDPSRASDYQIGDPAWHDLFVDPIGGRDGDDAYDGTSRSRAFQTLNAAWRSLPEGPATQATRIRLLPGTHVGAYLEDRQGTREFPILIEPTDGPGTVTIRPSAAGDSGSLQFFNCAYTYLQDFRISVDGGDGLHWERCHHVLARRMQVSSKRSEGQDETVKINQSHHVYLEDSDIADAGDNCVDVVAVQYGHIRRCKIHNSTDWGAYLKGGSAYWVLEGNEIYGCGTGGFTAGQGTGFQFMSPPWLHYETYDVKVVNNVIHDCEGAGLGVNGSYNVLMAHNTLYRVGARSHLLEFVHGRRGCDGDDAAACQPWIDAGGWGTTGEEQQYIPNRNLQFVNNVVYNPPGFRSEYQHFQIAGPVTPPSGANVPDPARADDHLVIRGNVIFNGPADWPLGVEEENSGCRGDSCNADQLRADNRINTFEPQFVNAATGDFHPLPGGNLAGMATAPADDFSWVDAPTRPPVPAGETGNQVLHDFDASTRPARSPPGALLPRP